MNDAAVKDEGSAFAPENGGSSAIDQIFALARSADIWSYDVDEVRPLQLAAMSERLEERRQSIPALDQRADQVGVDKVETMGDASTLLFSHASYKGYPESFVIDKQWTRLLRWLDRMAREDLTGVDVDSAVDLDDFIERVTAAGHPVLSTSGTSGKCSLLPQSQLDMWRYDENGIISYGWSHQLSVDAKMPGFFLAKSGGPYRGTYMHKSIAREFVKPDACFFLYEEPESITGINRAAQLSKRVADGTASPSELAEARALQRDAEAHTEARLEVILDELLAVADEPVLVWGTVYPNWRLVDAAAARGITFRAQPGTTVHVGGGTKSKVLPPDYWEQLRAFYGDAPVGPGAYGQGEVIALAPQCPEGRYHLAPTSLAILLDESGERLAVPGGDTVQGLIGIFDIAQDGRWGGLMTSDWVEVVSSPCACGLRSPAITKLSRIDAKSTADDKLSCAGRAEMFVRGI